MGPATLPPTLLTGIWPLFLLSRVSLGLGPFVKRTLLSLWNGFEGFDMKKMLLGLGRRIIDAIHGVDVYGWSSNLPKGMSRIWNSIFKHKEKFSKFTEFVIGDGKRIGVRVNSWSDPQSSTEISQHPYHFFKKNIENVECWCDSSYTGFGAIEIFCKRDE